jgi:hypothetical protein
VSRADILKRIADAHYQLADLYLALANESGSPERLSGPAAAASPAAAPASSPTRIDGPPVDEGGEAMCPKHRKPFTEGNYGPYCTASSDDPAWANKRGYCNITPKNAATYLRNRAAA